MNALHVEKKNHTKTMTPPTVVSGDDLKANLSHAAKKKKVVDSNCLQVTRAMNGSIYRTNTRCKNGTKSNKNGKIVEKHFNGYYVDKQYPCH